MAAGRKTARAPRQLPAKGRAGAAKAKRGGRGTSGAPKGVKKRGHATTKGKKAPAAAARKPVAPRTERIQLRWIAQARSGDKGDVANVALFAPTPETYEVFLREVTAERVKAHFGDYVKGRVDRYEVPNVRALNFVCYAALGGGGAASMRSDPLGKSYGSNLLRMEIDIPSDLLKRTPRLAAPEELPDV